MADLQKRLPVPSQSITTGYLVNVEPGYLSALTPAVSVMPIVANAAVTASSFDSTRLGSSVGWLTKGHGW